MIRLIRVTVTFSARDPLLSIATLGLALQMAAIHVPAVETGLHYPFGSLCRQLGLVQNASEYVQHKLGVSGRRRWP